MDLRWLSRASSPLHQTQLALKLFPPFHCHKQGRKLTPEIHWISKLQVLMQSVYFRQLAKFSLHELHEFTVVYKIITDVLESKLSVVKKGLKKFKIQTGRETTFLTSVFAPFDVGVLLAPRVTTGSNTSALPERLLFLLAFLGVGSTFSMPISSVTFKRESFSFTLEKNCMLC